MVNQIPKCGLQLIVGPCLLRKFIVYVIKLLCVHFDDRLLTLEQKSYTWDSSTLSRQNPVAWTLQFSPW